MMDGYDMTGWAWFGMTMMVVIAIAIVGLVAWAVTSSRARDRQLRDPTARDLLDARLARGEIDAAEYRERLDALRDEPAIARH